MIYVCVPIRIEIEQLLCQDIWQPSSHLSASPKPETRTITLISYAVAERHASVNHIITQLATVTPRLKTRATL